MFFCKSLILIAFFLFASTRARSASGDDLKLLKQDNFQVQTGGNLTVKTPAGKIEISSWEKNEANVKIYGNSNAEENVNFEITQSVTEIKVIGKMNKDKGSNLDIRYEIMVPKEYNVETDTKGGNIVITGLKGNKVVNTMGGNIHIQEGEGDIKANTMGGNIKMLTKEGKIDANTMGGNINLEYTGANKGIELNTMGGNIHVTLPSDINGEADFTTAAGKISCDFAEPEKSFASSTLKAKFNNGGEAINISTAAGNIRVEKKQ